MFCPAAYQPSTSIYSGLSAVHAIIRQKRQNRLQGFTAAFPLICPIPAHTTQQPHKPPTRQLRHAGGHTVKRSTSTDTRYQRHARTLYSPAQPPYYNKVYKDAAATQARRGQQYRPGAPADGSASPPVQGQRRAARNRWRLSPHFFRAFAR